MFQWTFVRSNFCFDPPFKKVLFEEISEYVLKDDILDTFEDISHKICVRCCCLKSSDQSISIAIMRQKPFFYKFAEMITLWFWL